MLDSEGAPDVREVSEGPPLFRICRHISVAAAPAEVACGSLKVAALLPTVPCRGGPTGG